MITMEFITPYTFSPSSLNEHYAGLDPSDRTAIGMRPENMIKKCVVDGATNCSSLFNVTVYNTVERGNCFKLNSNGEVGEVRSGPFHGISLDIFLSRDEYPWIPTNDRVGML